MKLTPYLVTICVTIRSLMRYEFISKIQNQSSGELMKIQRQRCFLTPLVDSSQSHVDRFWNHWHADNHLKSPTWQSKHLKGCSGAAYLQHPTLECPLHMHCKPHCLYFNIAFIEPQKRPYWVYDVVTTFGSGFFHSLLLKARQHIRKWEPNAIRFPGNHFLQDIFLLDTDLRNRIILTWEIG